MNVLDRGTVPRVMSLKETLVAWLDHRKDVFVRRTQHRLEQIARRLEILDGYIVAYLNLDEVIRIIREEDEPKALLMKTLQADRWSGRGHPQHAPALAAQARGDRTAHRTQDADRRAERISMPCSPPTRSSGARSPSRSPTSRRPMARTPRSAAARPSSPMPRIPTTPKRPRPPSSSGTDHGDPLREGLDPRHEGPHARGQRREGLQGRRPAEAIVLRRDHRQAAAALDRGQGLYPRRRPSTRRPRPGRAGAPDGRSRRGPGLRRSLRPYSRARSA